MRSAKQATKRSSISPFVEKVVEALTQRSNGGAKWKITIQKRCRPEGGFRHALARDCDHVGRSVDSKHPVSGVDKAPSPQTATAAKVDNQSTGNAPASQDIQHTGSGLLSKAAKAHVMNVCEIPLISLRLHFAERSR